MNDLSDSSQKTAQPSPERASKASLLWRVIPIIIAIIALIVAGLAFARSDTTVSSDPDSPPIIVPNENGTWDTNGDGLLTVGFSQNGSESSWRVANTRSYQEYFVEENGFRLRVAEADNDNAKQIQQVLDLIAADVEVIVLSPESDEGWEPVLYEAKAAGIPVINVDRELSDLDSYYEFFFGSDMRAEGD